MNTNRQTLMIILVLCLTISGCAPGRFLGSTITPSPTHTLTPTKTPGPTSTPTVTSTPTPVPTLTPIPGIQVPVVVDGKGVRVRSAVLGIEPPPDYRLQPGFSTVLELEMSFTGIQGMQDPLLDEIRVVDENNNATPAGYFSFTIEVGADGQLVFDKADLLFGVKSDAHIFSLLLPGGQMIDLTSLLESR